MLKEFSKYIRVDDQDDPTNFILRSKAIKNYEYKIIPKDCWT